MDPVILQHPLTPIDPAARPEPRLLEREIIHGELKALPTGATFLRILGVNYVHLKTDDDGDLYVTEHGLPFLEHLKPENWYENRWFQAHRTRLEGSGTVYRVPTRPLEDHCPQSLQLVVKWSRVGQDVPLNTFQLGKAINTEFNSPFEEFSLVNELRTRLDGAHLPTIYAQKPLAIYVPPEYLQLWQTGRSREKIYSKISRHASVEIDILRSYILLYGWIKGIDAVSAYGGSFHDPEAQRQALEKLTQRVEHELQLKGYTVADHKPTHCIVRMRDGLIRRRKNGQIAYALVDYELLARTPEHEEAVKAAGRSRYLLLQRDRFAQRADRVFPSDLKPARVLNVDYIHGRAESTGGILWVVGKDPELFSYFLPERWRKKQIRLSRSNRTFYTQTKDRIHLVWKVSRVGDLPAGDLADPTCRTRVLHGYNSPFEEFGLALEMAAAGLRVVYPRAIYVTAQSPDAPGTVLDARHFERMKHVLSPEDLPVLQMEPDYILIWGYWRGNPDEAAPDAISNWTPVDALRARQMGIITASEQEELITRQRDDLACAGFEDLNLKADHILLTHIPGGKIKRDEQGRIELRHCNLEMVRRIGTRRA